jgi:DNA-binding IclR family transcriptional regulator
MHSSPSPADDGKSGTALQKATKLLQAIAAAGSPSQLAELADAVGLPRPSVHRLLSQLEEVGMVRRDLSGKNYEIGPTWVRLAVDGLSNTARRPPIQDIMRQLVDRVRESCNLGILREHEVLYIERVECDWPLRLQLQAGSRVPLHCTASGKLFLAHMNPSKRHKLLGSLRLERYTGNTITEREALEAECERIRSDGLSINREEFHLGLIGVGVPVLGREGQLVAALAIHAPIFRMNVAAAEANVPLLRDTAQKIASEAGLFEG